MEDIKPVSDGEERCSSSLQLKKLKASFRNKNLHA
jgi:hypothetical protein